MMELPDPKNELRMYFVAEKVLTSEMDFWKEMRSAWQSVIIEGVMKEYNSKLELAKVFTDNYGTILKNFVKDDQEQESTVVNLTVQFFTVKSIAHHLLATTDVFTTLIDLYAARIIEHLKDFPHEGDPPGTFNCSSFVIVTPLSSVRVFHCISTGEA